VICNCEVIEEGGKELFLKAPTRASALRALLQGAGLRKGLFGCTSVQVD
jgi:hypothetical protein